MYKNIGKYAYEFDSIFFRYDERAIYRKNAITFPTKFRNYSNEFSECRPLFLCLKLV